MKVLRAPFRPRGGVHPAYAKEATAGRPIVTKPPPATLMVSLAQHLGAPSKPLVKKGDAVLRGQAIAEPVGYVSTWVHAPVSGTIKSVEQRVTISGQSATVVEIAADGQDRAAEAAVPTDWTHVEPRVLVDQVLRAGIVGMGGAGFPTHVKLLPPAGKTIDTLILNGAECEPYLTADHRLMVEQAARVWEGALVLRHILAAPRLCVAVEDNKPDAIAALEQVMRGAEGDVALVVLKSWYPQGAERQLIYAVTGREVPSGGLPMDVGVLVENVGTAAAVADAVVRGQPLIERVVTVAGAAVREPRNVLARVGTPLRDVLAFCGGLTPEVGKVLCGGPMMGVAQASDDAGLAKTTSGVLALSRDQVVSFSSQPCISCGRCVRACPAGLLPCTLSEHLEAEQYDRAEQLHVLDCIECGACAYVCPARRPLVQHMRQGKARVLARRREARAKQEARA